MSTKGPTIPSNGGAPPTSPTPRSGDPICANCGYLLRGLTESSRCPECGKPLVEVLVRSNAGAGQKVIRRRSAATLFGWPVIDVAFGARPEFGETFGRARGIIAIGDQAVGGVAIGGGAVGVVAIGGGAVGVCSIGGAGVGLLTGVGGLGVGGLAVGGAAVGGIATGGGAVGVVAQGGGALGVYARGGGAFGSHVIGPMRFSQQAQDMFDSLAFVAGGGAPRSMMGFARPLAWVVCIDVLVAGVIIVAALAAHSRHARRREYGGGPSA